MSATLSVTVNAAAVPRSLQLLRQRLQDLRPALQDIGIEFAERTRQQFSQGQSPHGQTWTPLSATTQAKSQGRRAGGQPLLDTGRLRASIGSAASGTSVTVGTNVIYAAVHQFGAARGAFGATRHGAPIPWGRVPARPYLPIGSAGVDLPAPWAQSARDILTDHITGGMA